MEDGTVMPDLKRELLTTKEALMNGTPRPRQRKHLLKVELCLAHLKSISEKKSKKL